MPSLWLFRLARLKVPWVLLYCDGISLASAHDINCGVTCISMSVVPDNLHIVQDHPGPYDTNDPRRYIRSASIFCPCPAPPYPPVPCTP